MQDFNLHLTQNEIEAHQQHLIELRRNAFRTGEPGRLRVSVGRVLISLGERVRGMEPMEPANLPVPRRPLASA